LDLIPALLGRLFGGMLFCPDCGKMIEPTCEHGRIRSQCKDCRAAARSPRKPWRGSQPGGAEGAPAAEGGADESPAPAPTPSKVTGIAPGGKCKRLVCFSCRDIELARWWLGGPVVELPGEVDHFDSASQAKFKRAISRAAECLNGEGDDEEVAAELVTIGQVSKSGVDNSRTPGGSIRVEFWIDAEFEYEVQAMRRRLKFEVMRRHLAEEGLEALPPPSTLAVKKKKEGGFPSDLKKGVKAACASVPQGFEQFVNLCKSYAHGLVARKEALTEFKLLLLSTPLGQEPQLIRLKELVVLFRKWSKDLKPAAAAADADAAAVGHSPLCILGQSTCFRCIKGQDHCACCTQLRQLTLLRSLEHTGRAEEGCKCMRERRREVVVRRHIHSKLVDREKVEEEAAEKMLDALEVDFGALYGLSDSAGPGSMVIDTTCANGHRDWVRALAVHPTDHTLLASCSDDYTVKLWCMLSGACVSMVAHRGPVKTIAWSPCGRVLLSGGADHTTKMWLFNVGLARRESYRAERYRPVDVRSLRPEAWSLRNTLADHSSTVSSAAWACCRACAAGASGGGGAAGGAGGSGGSECQGQARCGKMFATGSHDQTIRVYRYAHVAWDEFAQQRAELLAATQARREALAQVLGGW